MMSQTIDLKAYRDKVVQERAFGPWRKRFGESYGAETKMVDLSDSTLYFLAKPGEEAAFAFYELIMGILDLGQAPKFYYLDDHEQLNVVDIHLFLADQARLELMRRLEWLTRSPAENHTLLEMVRTFEKVRDEIREKPLMLSELHPEYESYKKLTPGDKQVFIRRKLLNALEAFRIRANI